MPLPTPTFDELIRAYLAEYRTRLGNVDTSPGSDLYARAWTLAQFEANSITKARWILRQQSPLTAEEEGLGKHGRIIGMAYLPPTRAQGRAVVPGAAGTTISAGLQFTDPTRALFAVASNVTIATGDTSAEVTLDALEAGLAGNLAAGTVLSLVGTVAGLEGTASVAARFTGGTDRETVEEFRARVVRTMANPAYSGNSAHGVSWIEAVPGVRRGFVRPGYDGPGTVLLTFQGVYNGGTNGRITPALQDEVQAYFRAQVADVAEVNAVCVLPVALPVDVEIRVAARPGFEFDWTGSLAATAVSPTQFTVFLPPESFQPGHRVVWAPATGAEQMQRVATVQTISAGPGTQTVTLVAPGFATPTDLTAAAFTGAQTIYPGGRLTTDVQTALLKEGGAFDKLTPGDVDPSAVTDVLRPRFPPVSPDYPTDLLRAEISATVLGTFGVVNVAVVSPSADVLPDVGHVVVPRRVLIRPY